MIAWCVHMPVLHGAQQQTIFAPPSKETMMILATAGIVAVPFCMALYRKKTKKMEYPKTAKIAPITLSNEQRCKMTGKGSENWRKGSYEMLIKIINFSHGWQLSEASRTLIELDQQLLDERVLELAIEKGNLPLLQELLTLYKKVNENRPISSCYKYLAIKAVRHTATNTNNAVERCIDILKVLEVGTRLDINECVGDAMITPLMQACAQGNDLLARRLVDECGADVNVLSVRGNTALISSVVCPDFLNHHSHLYRGQAWRSYPVWHVYYPYQYTGSSERCVQLLLDKKADSTIGRNRLFDLLVPGRVSDAHMYFFEPYDPKTGKLLTHNYPLMRLPLGDQRQGTIDAYFFCGGEKPYCSSDSPHLLERSYNDYSCDDYYSGPSTNYKILATTYNYTHPEERALAQVVLKARKAPVDQIVDTVTRLPTDLLNIIREYQYDADVLKQEETQKVGGTNYETIRGLDVFQAMDPVDTTEHNFWSEGAAVKKIKKEQQPLSSLTSNVVPTTYNCLVQ